MAQKPYKPQADEKQPVKEPIATYGCMNSQQSKGEVESLISSAIYSVSDEERDSIMKAKKQYAEGEFLTQEDMDKMVGEWLS